jgi:hypothetical protein
MHQALERSVSEFHKPPELSTKYKDFRKRLFQIEVP